MADKRSPRIFIAEDDPNILELLRIRLELSGYSTFYARTGRHALERIINVAPDAAILDIGLPGMDGFEILQSLRANARLKTLPVMMLTARHAQNDVQRAIFAGAQDYLTKPFNEHTLLQRVARLTRPTRSPITADPSVQFV